jgi:hypothetical protein
MTATPGGIDAASGPGKIGSIYEGTSSMQLQITAKNLMK